MFTARYHAISLVAVFLALGIGVLLGVALGEEGIVSGASRDLEKSLRGDLDQAARATRSCAGSLPSGANTRIRSIRRS